MRALFVSSLLGVVLATLPGPANAAVQEPACSPFSLTQTYRGWGPADHYGRRVTVLYSGTQCSSVGGGAAEVDITGTATAFPGPDTGGPALDVHAFEASGTWATPGATAGWPPPWWGCSVGDAEVRWVIPGVYSLAVSADDGAWALDVQTWGQRGRTVHWVGGCAGR
jgi:hypothetical protein